MRVFKHSLVLVATGFALPLAAQDALIGGTVIDGTGRVIEDGIVVSSEGRITCVGTEAQCPLPRGTAITDISGSYVTPGLVDAHVHFGQTGWLDGRPDGIEDRAVYPYEETIAALRSDPGRWHRSYLCSGVTAVFDVGGAPWTVTESHATDTDRPDRVHVRAAGPLITHFGLNEFFAYGSLADQPMFLSMESPEQIRADVARLVAMGSSAVKVWYIQPEPAEQERLDTLLMEVGAAAKAVDLPLIVHATELESAKAALRAGAKMLVHSVEDASVDEEFLALMKANDAIYAPTLLAGRNWGIAVFSIAIGEPVTIDDPNDCVDEALRDRIAEPQELTHALAERTGGKLLPFARRFERSGRDSFMMAHNLRAVRDAGIRIVMATDAGNPLTLHGPSVYNEMQAMQLAGMTPAEIISAATIEGARAMGMADDIGTLEEGKIADLLVLAQDPRADVKAFRSLTHVMRRGELKTQEELQVR